MVDARGPPREAPPAKPSSTRRGWRDSLGSLADTLTRADAAAITAYVLLSLGAALAGAVAAIVLASLVQPGHPPPLDDGALGLRGDVRVLALEFVTATSCFALLRWLEARLGARLASGYASRLRCAVHARLIGAPLASLHDSTSAEIANVLTYNVEIVTQGFRAVLHLLVVGITTAVSLGFAIWVSPVLTLSLPVFAGFGLIALRAYGREQSLISRQRTEDMTRLFWFSEDFLRRLRHIRSFEREDVEKAGYATVAAQLGDGERRQLDLVAAGRLILELLAGAGIAAVIVIAGQWHWVDQASLIAVGLLLGRLLPYVTSSRQSFQQLRVAAPAFRLWRRYANLPSSHHCPAPRGASVAVRELRIDRVRVNLPFTSFGIEDLVLIPGELTLVSGDSGAGKSSLVDVLAGMIEPDEFAARVDGRPLDFHTYRRLVRKGAYVSQNVRPWQATVRECLLWAAPGATDEALQGALEDIGLDRRLAATDDGLDLALQSASSRLSGGELQRLLLAQVILRKPLLALLDEATSALDAASEVKVLTTLRHRLPDTILIVVSHRTGLASIADRRLEVGNQPLAPADGRTAESIR